MSNRILTSIADLFARGLDNLVSFFFTGRSRQPTLKDAINERLSQQNEEAATRAVNEFGRRVNQAEIAADLLHNIGQITSTSIPKAPGLSFTNPETGLSDEAKTTVVISTGTGEDRESIAVEVYHSVEASWEEIKEEAERLAREITSSTAKYKNLFDIMSNEPGDIKVVPIRTFRQ